MFVFLLQAVLLLAIAYILGAVVGCLIRTQFNDRPVHAAARKPSAQTVSEAAEPAVTEPAAATAPAVPAAKKAAKPKAPAAAKKTTRPDTASAPARKKSAEASGGADDLKWIKGIGRQIEAKLNAAGITRYQQIAEWTEKDAAEFGEKLSFSGRIEREDWVAQAKTLAKGEMTDFANRVAKGKVASSKSAPKRGSARNKG